MQMNYFFTDLHWSNYTIWSIYGANLPNLFHFHCLTCIGESCDNRNARMWVNLWFINYLIPYNFTESAPVISNITLLVAQIIVYVTKKQ